MRKYLIMVLICLSAALHLSAQVEDGEVRSFNICGYLAVTEVEGIDNICRDFYIACFPGSGREISEIFSTYSSIIDPFKKDRRLDYACRPEFYIRQNRINSLPQKYSLT